MKTQVLVLSLLALTGLGLFLSASSSENTSFLRSSENIRQIYTQWKAQFGKNTNGSEDEFRFTIFKENYDFVQQHNANNSDLTLGMTQFADLTNSEYRDSKLIELIQSQEEKQYANIQSRNGLPDSVNWVEDGAVTPVEDQGSCGACWAFATVGGLEGLNFVQTGNLVSLSAQQLTSCLKFPFSLGCGGGNTIFAYPYAANTGIETQEEYPYTNAGSKKTEKCQIDKSLTQKYNSGYELIAPQDIDAIKTQLVEQPLSVAVDAGSIFFQLYRGGILKSEFCGTELNHAITLVGYQNSDNTWQVKNSWGLTWGEQGFGNILIQEGDGVCGIQMEVTYPTPL